MKKSLSAKVQKIAPSIPDSSANLSNALVIKPDDDATLEKKGTVYAAFDISSQTSLDALLVTKVVNDVLHDSYFQSESASPIQAIEKAILELRDKIVKIPGGGQSEDLKFDIATAVLWGNTLYLVQYGSAKIYLMRDGTVKPVEAATEGRFSVASGIVKDGDVVVLATEHFATKFPPDKLVTATGLGTESLGQREACLIMKFSVDKAFTKDETIDFGIADQQIEKATNRPKISIKKPSLKIGSVTDKLPAKRKLILSIGVAALLVGLFVIGNAIFGKNSTEQTDEPRETSEQSEIVEEAPQEIVINEEEDTLNKVQRVESNVFYDLRVTDTDIITSEIAVVADTVFVADTANGVLYYSDANAPKFTALSTYYVGARNLSEFDGTLAFTDSEGYKTLDPESLELTEQYYGSVSGIAVPYIDYLYEANGTSITKYTKQDDNTLEGDAWTQDADLEGTIGIGIDISIFVLTNEGEIHKFTSGSQDEFGITGLNDDLSGAVSFVTSIELENIYVADAGNKRVVVLDKDGALVQQYKLTEENNWDDIRGFAVNQEETKGYVLNGSKVYEFDL